MTKKFDKPTFTPTPTDDFEIEDVEDYRSEQDHKFNHQSLVMDCMKRCIDAGCHEMRSGWFNEKVDSRGNINRNYVDDTRKKFVSAVKMVKINMACDIDDEAKKEIKDHLEKLEEKKKDLLDKQWGWWTSLTPKYKMLAANAGEHVQTKGAFNGDLVWFQMWVEEEVDTYRLILESLIKLTKRLDFYEAEIIEA